MAEENGNGRKKGIIFDNTINVGNIILILMVLGTLWQLNNSIVVQLTEIKQKVDLMWLSFHLTVEKGEK